MLHQAIPLPTQRQRQRQRQRQPLLKRRNKQSSFALKLYGAVVFVFWSPSLLYAASRAMLFSQMNGSSEQLTVVRSAALDFDDSDTSNLVATVTTSTKSSFLEVSPSQWHKEEEADELTEAVLAITADNKRAATNQTILQQFADQAAATALQNRKNMSAEFVYSRYSHHQPELPAHGNVLLYLTSDLSDSHVRFLEHCWPTLLERSPLLHDAHVLVYANPISSNSDKTKEALNLMQNQVFANNPSLRIFVTNTTISQQFGQLDSMWQSSKRQWWWSGSNFAASNGGDDDPGYAYDWVLRLYPDVLIRNETFLVDTMQDPVVEGIFADCSDGLCPNERQCRNRRIHTDIMLFRPDSLRQNRAFFVPKKRRASASAEDVAMITLQDVVSKGADRWIPNTGYHNNICQVGHARAHFGRRSPVVHTHGIIPKSTAQCASALL